MTLAKIIAAVEASGASIRILPDGRATLVGSVPEEVLAAIRADREAFLEAWDADRRDRYLRCPPPNLLLRSSPPEWRREVRRRVEEFALGQGSEVARWALLRATDYREAKPTWSESEAAAAALIDLLQWQWGSRHEQPELVLMDFDAVPR